MKTIETLEKELADCRRQLVQARRAVPRESIPDHQLLTTAGTPVRLTELFGQKRELLLVHNMGKRCVYCTLWADGLIGFAKHLEDRAAFVLVSPDEPKVLDEFSRGRGWPFRVVSCHGTSFARDMGFEPEPGKHWPGVSSLALRPDGGIERVAKAHFGPGDDYCAIWHMFDLLPEGAAGWSPKYAY